MSKANNLTDFLTDTANAIRSKKGTTAKINPQDFAVEIESIKPIPTLQAKTISPSTSQQVVTPDSGNDGLSKVTVNAISPTKGAQTYTPKTTNQTIPSGRWLTGTQTIKGDANLVPSNIKNGVTIFGVTGTAASSGKYHYYVLEHTSDTDFSGGDTDPLPMILVGHESSQTGGTLWVNLSDDEGGSLAHLQWSITSTQHSFWWSWLSNGTITIGQPNNEVSVYHDVWLIEVYWEAADDSSAQMDLEWIN